MNLIYSKKTASCMFLVVAVLIFSPNAFSIPLYKITDLGTLGGSYSFGMAVNDYGQTTGYSSNKKVNRAFIADANGNMKDIGIVGNKYNESYGYDINNKGQITGNIDWYQSLKKSAFVTDINGNMIDLGTMGGAYSYGRGINDKGIVTGFSYTEIDLNHQRAFITDDNYNLVDVGTLGGDSSSGYAINNQDQVTGWSHITASGAGHAFVSEFDGSLTDLGTLGWGNSMGYDINDKGRVTGISHTKDNNLLAFVTDSNDKMISLGSFVDGKPSSGLGINNLNQVVGYSYINPTGYILNAYLWDSVNGMLNLNDLVVDLNVNWNYLSIAYDISNTGYITGVGITNDNESHAFLLTKISQSVPEPSTIILVFLGLFLIVLWKRQKIDDADIKNP